MVKRPDGGAIVNIGDWEQVRPYLGYSAYFSSKGAVSAITKTLAVELVTRNPKVRVNQIAPGPVMLPPNLSQAERHEAIRDTLVKREVGPHNIAQTVLAVVNNDFVTGVTLPVNGGCTLCAPE
jgi:pteridine reductase